MVGRAYRPFLNISCTTKALNVNIVYDVFRENDATPSRGSGSPPVVPSGQESAGPEGLAPGTLGSARTRLPATPLTHRALPQPESPGGALRTCVQRAPWTLTDCRHQRPQDREGGTRQGRVERPRQPLPDARHHERIRSVVEDSRT